MSRWKPKPNQYTSPVYTKPKGQDPRTKVPIRRPLPGIVILVHGVNDIGEAYPTQAGGICDGLNLRLGRTDLTPGDWDVERSCPAMRKATYERRHAAQGYNPIIPFYWGYRPVDKDTYDTDQARYQDELRKRGPADSEAPYNAYWLEGANQANRGYQNTDCFDNWLDELFARGGGVFANATTNLVDMWGPGGDLFWLVRQLSKAGDDLSHAIYKNPNRIYIVNAARRLANLILMIRRDNEKTQNDTINIVAHSQGTLVSMLANFFVANGDRPARPADCLILNHSPYSLETPALEQIQSDWGQQTVKARTETLLNFCSLMDRHKATGPDTSTLVEDGILSPSVAGKPEHTRDNHGKVFNYFCLHDGVVSLLNVQGIGWQGVPTRVSDKAGPAFAQRMFVDGRTLHTPPGPYTLPKIDMPAFNRAVPAGEVRNINAPQLPDLGFVFRLPGGCELLGASDWGVDSAALAEIGRNTVTEMVDNLLPDKIDRYFPPMLTGDKKGPSLSPSEVAEVQQAFRDQGKKDWTLIEARQPERNRLEITRYMTREELLDKARNTHTNISNHSAIVLNRDASRCVTVFDLAIGQCMSFDRSTIDGGEFWQKLLRLADWRDSDAPDDKPYYTKGILPRDIKPQMNKPPVIPGIVNETVPVATLSERTGDTRMTQTVRTLADTKNT